MKRLLLGVLFCIASVFTLSVQAQESDTLSMTVKFEYDKEALAKAAKALDPEGETKVVGKLVKVYSNGGESSTYAEFSQSKDKDGKLSAVSAKEIEDFFTISNVFIMFCACLVFIMHLGFATLETGLTRAKNTVNILFKNVSIVAIATLMYAIIGFNLMYPGSWMIEGIMGVFTFGIGPDETGMTPVYYTGYTYWTDFLFQAMFAAATASVVSGAVCERIKLNAFLIFCTIFAGLVYPILGSAHWGSGFLADMNFIDLAGSTLVHSVGGWGALAGAIVLGPRIGKYVNGRTNAIMGHNLPLATIGAMLLWFGWFGFNSGSQLDADPEGTSTIMVSTLLSSCAGVVASMIVSWVIQKKPDLTMILNGALAGLVGITAGAHVITGGYAVITGLVSGVLVVLFVLFVDKMKIDDPVGAVSVHLVCGIWGTLACGLFGGGSIGVQALGVLYYAIAFPVALAIFFVLKVTIGIRVHEEEEIIGLDLSEHGAEAYSGFQIFTNQ
ncbi:MAG: ammonium transporter [Lentisphaeraceae bacterium]|nr:ammonium transporter [Lentisphaeraceae bacterium]